MTAASRSTTGPASGGGDKQLVPNRHERRTRRIIPVILAIYYFVSNLSNKNVADSISSNAEEDELLICPVNSEVFFEEFIPYPQKKCKRRDSDTDSKFELRECFLDLRTGVLRVSSHYNGVNGENKSKGCSVTGHRTRVCTRGSNRAIGLSSGEDICQTVGDKEVWTEFY